jgi:hypothetical protein
MQSHHWRLVAPIRKRGSAAKVVKMSVRVPQMGDAPIQLLGFRQDHMPIPSRVDDSGLLGFRIGNKIGVGESGAKGKCVYCNHRG